MGTGHSLALELILKPQQEIGRKAILTEKLRYENEQNTNGITLPTVSCTSEMRDITANLYSNPRLNVIFKAHFSIFI